MSHIWTRDSTLGEAEGAGRIPRPHHRSVMQPPSFPPQSTIPGWPTAPPTTFAPAPPPPLRLPLEPSPAKRSLRFLIDNGYPLQILYPHLIQCWKAYIRPDGSVYFRYQSTTGPTMRLVTCEDIRDPQIYETVMALTTDRLDRAQRSGTYDRFPDDWEFVVESAVASGIDNGPVMKLVSHKLGWTFFLQADHSLELGSKTDYWRCVSKYPMHLRTLPSGSDFDFLGALTFGVNERALDFRATTFPLNDDQTQRAIQLYHDLKDGGPSAYPILAWHIARVMTIIEESRDIALYGTMDSRLYRDVAIPKPTRTVQVMDLLLMFFLFGAHRMYRRRLQAAAPKKNVHQFEFQKLMRSFLLEWADSNLLATVFVSANVAFLAIPNINGLQKTASLASSLFSLTSIAAGVHHVWQHRGKDAVQREESAQYMKHMDSVSEEHGLTVLSCFLALPIVCLLWSILCFTVAVSALCFQSSGRVAQSLLGTGLGILGMFVAWTLVVFWRIWKDKPTAEIGKDLNNEDMGWREGFPAKFGRWKMKVKGWIPAVTGRSAAEPVEKSSDAGSGSLSA